MFGAVWNYIVEQVQPRQEETPDFAARNLDFVGKLNTTNASHNHGSTSSPHHAPSSPPHRHDGNEDASDDDQTEPQGSSVDTPEELSIDVIVSRVAESNGEDGFETTLTFKAFSPSLDFGDVLSWSELDPTDTQHAALLQDAFDPILHIPFLEDDGSAAEPIVQLSCHSDAIPCVYFKSTAEQVFTVTTRCPTCGHMYKSLPGSQPDGTMDIHVRARSCAGFEDYSTIVLTYYFDNGIQGSNHPHPGRFYSGTARMAYLPNCKEGRSALTLLIKGFKQGELFTVGKSLTTGIDNTTVWGSIHQKTRTSGGVLVHGWPDPSFFMRLRQECAAKGIFTSEHEAEMYNDLREEMGGDDGAMMEDDDGNDQDVHDD